MENYKNTTEEKSIFAFHTMELKKRISYDEYIEIREHFYTSGYRVFQRNGKLECHEFKHIGILVYLKKDNKGASVSLRINPRKTLGDENYYGIFEPSEINVKNLMYMLSTTLSFSNLGDIKEYKLKRLDFCKNVETEPTIADDYMNLIYRACPSYSFKKEMHFKDGKMDKDGVYFRSKLLEIYIYQKTKQLKKIGILDEISSDSAVLRFEIRFDRKKIRDLEKMSGIDSLESLLLNAAEYSKKNFMFYIPRLFYTASYRRFADGMGSINNSRFHERTKELMRTIYTEASQKHDLQSAIIFLLESGKIDERKATTLLGNFEEIDLNPVPLSQRCSSGKSILSSIPELLG